MSLLTALRKPWASTSTVYQTEAPCTRSIFTRSIGPPSWSPAETVRSNQVPGSLADILFVGDVLVEHGLEVGLDFLRGLALDVTAFAEGFHHLGGDLRNPGPMKPHVAIPTRHRASGKGDY